MSPKQKDYVFVSIQVILFLAYTVNINILAVNFYLILNYTGLILAILGSILCIASIITLNKNLSPFPSPKAHSNLIENGPYKYIRHPIYTGILFCLLGYSLYTNSVYKLSITLLVFILFTIKSKYEEKMLLNTFTSYASYLKKTDAFLPKCF